MPREIRAVCIELRRDGMRLWRALPSDPAPPHLRDLWLTPAESKGAGIGEVRTLAYMSALTLGAWYAKEATR